MELSKLKLPSLSSNFLIWIVVLFIIIGFGTSSSALGVNFFSKSNNNQKGSHKHYPDKRAYTAGQNKVGLLPIPAPGGSRGVLGGNGIFLIAIIVLLLICKDEKKEECINDTPVVDYTEIDDQQ